MSTLFLSFSESDFLYLCCLSTSETSTKFNCSELKCSMPLICAVLIWAYSVPIYGSDLNQSWGLETGLGAWQNERQVELLLNIDQVLVAMLVSLSCLNRLTLEWWLWVFGALFWSGAPDYGSSPFKPIQWLRKSTNLNTSWCLTEIWSSKMQLFSKSYLLSQNLGPLG